MFPQVHESTIDGIPTYWTEIDQTSKAIVTFGVGERDEPASLSGITEVAAQIVLSKMEPIAHSHTAVVGASVLTFTLVGAQADLPSLVDELCDHIRHLSHAAAEDIRLAKDFLSPDGGPESHTAFTSLLAYRFGYAGIGKATAGTIGIQTLDADDLAAWSARYLHRDNLVLAFIGAAPAMAAGSLAVGPARTAAPEHDVIDRPTILLSDRYELSFSLISRPIVSSLLAGALEYEIMDHLARRTPLIRSMDFELIDVDAHTTSIDVHLEPLKGATPRALDALVDLLWRTRVEGVSPQAIAHVMRDWKAASENVTEVAEHALRAAAYGDLLARPVQSPTAMQAAADAFTHDSITGLVRDALPTLLIAVNDDVDLDTTKIDKDVFRIDDGLIWRPATTDEAARSTRWRARRRARREGVKRLSLNETRLRLSGSSGAAEVLLEELIDVAANEIGWLSLTDRRGRVGFLDPSDFHGGRSIVDELAGRLGSGAVRSIVTP